MSEPHDSERRALSRAATLREAVFDALREHALTRRGSVTDISPSGLRLETTTPERVGAPLAIEVQPRPGQKAQGLMLVRGRVVWCKALDNGLWAMGVHLTMDWSPTAGAIEHPHEARQAMDLLVGQFRALGSGASAPLPFLETSQEAIPDTVDVRFRSETPSRRRWWIAGLLCALTAAIAVLLLLLRGCIVSHGMPVNNRSVARTASPDTAAASRPRALPSLPPLAVARTADSALSRAQDFHARSEHAQAQKAYAEAVAHPDATPVQKYAARLGQAQAALSQNDPKAAQEALAKLEPRDEQIPKPWQDLGELIRAAVAQGNPDALPKPMADMLGPKDATAPPPAKPGETPAPGPAPLVRIDIDTAKYVLTVYRGPDVLAAFPVGLGANDSTPRGDFAIANKIENPDWYNHGEVVKHGDPRNPLGGYWMGLGRGGKATSYGIHPTNDPEAIRANSGRGCVRMLPEHAQKVFEWCPIGAPVHIAP